MVIAEPQLSFDRVLSAGPAIARMRAVLDELGLGAENAVRVRITGYPALNDEEMRGLVLDVGVAGAASLPWVLSSVARAAPDTTSPACLSSRRSRSIARLILFDTPDWVRSSSSAMAVWGLPSRKCSTSGSRSSSGSLSMKPRVARPVTGQSFGK